VQISDEWSIFRINFVTIGGIIGRKSGLMKPPCVEYAQMPTTEKTTFDVESVRRDFPILSREIHGKPLVYLDNAASAQKPETVIDAMSRFYREHYSNVHRGVHLLSVEATRMFDEARGKAAALLGAPSERGIVITKGATEGFNLIARGFLRPRLREGDEILLTEMEHHANIVPWQIVAAEAGARVLACPITDAGEIDEDAFERMLGPRVRLVSLVHVSNVLGTVNPVARLAAIAKARGIPVVVDGAQAVPHFAPQVGEIGCDFYLYSGHKVFGPTGVGVLWGRPELLDEMPPYQGGGDMIDVVDFAGTTFRQAPERFEAGTPPIAPAIGLGAAVDYLMALDAEAREDHERELHRALHDAVAGIDGARIFGTAQNRTGVVSFAIDGVHPHDLGTMLDLGGVAVRVGHHCAQPLMKRLGVTATARASVAFYNTLEEIETFARALHKACGILR